MRTQQRLRWHATTTSPVAAILIALGASCGTNTSSSATVQVSATHEIVANTTDAKANAGANASQADRFGLNPSTSVRPGASDANITPIAAKPLFTWDTPKGWQELPNTAMRAANFRVAGDERAECALTFLAGDGGGLAANINRWRAQMSLSPATPTDVAMLTTAPFLGRSATLVDLRGTFTGMSNGAPRPDYHLTGLLLVESTGSAFLKMTGPDEVLTKEREAFLDLASSIMPAHTAAAQKAMQPASNDSDSTRPANSTPTPPTAAARGEYAYELPAGWKNGEDKPSRAVNVVVRDGTTECYVTALNGDGGGLAANVDRWCTQLGIPALLAKDIEALPRIQLLGGEARLVQLDGTRASMLGALSIGPERSVFVKLNGSSATIARERENFTSFCASLRSAR